MNQTQASPTIPNPCRATMLSAVTALKAARQEAINKLAMAKVELADKNSPVTKIDLVALKDEIVACSLRLEHVKNMLLR